jgi:hypothetical protein
LSARSSFAEMLEAIEQSAPVAALRDSTFAYPLVNALHIVGVALLFGAIVALDLRLIGWRRTAGPADAFARLLLPVAIGGLALAIPAGLLLFATDARAYLAAPLFQAKLLVIALAILNALLLRAVDWRGPRGGRWAALAGAASILLWLTAIILGRLVGYF